MITVKQEAKSRCRGGLALTAWALALLLCAPIVLSAAQVVPLSVEERVRQADAIVLGAVIDRQSRWGDASHRWIVTDYTFAVEETLYRSARGDAVGSTIVLTYWGGTIGDETYAISDLRVPVVGERLLLMLRPGWASRTEFSPVVGLNQGLFSVAPEGSTAQRAAPLMSDAAGRQLALAADGSISLATAGDVMTGASLPAFRNWLNANIARLKASAPAASLLTVPDAGSVMPVREKMALVGGPSPSGLRSPMEQADERSLSSAIATPGVPPSTDRSPSAPSTITERSTALEYVTIGPKPNLPIVVNNFPDSFAPWSPEDEFQMSKWNYYADVFRVYATPTTTFAWPDGVFDLDGFVSSATLQSVYGSPWGAGVIGVTFTRSSGSTVLEADIALNPAFTYTLNDEAVFNGTSAQGFRQVMLHELGHMLGLDHSFNAMAVMNYMPSAFRSFALPYSDDAAGARAVHPGSAVSRTDLGVNLFYASGFQSITDATYPTNVQAGGLLTVNNYTVENVGTTTIAAPTVEWYLTAARNFNSTFYFLDKASYGPALPPFTSYTPGTLQRTFRVPTTIAPGLYYLAAFVRNDDGAGQASFPFSNNFAFSRRQIAVSSNPPATPTLVSPANGSSGVSLTPTLAWNAAAGAISYDVYLGPTSSPAFYASTTSTSLRVGTRALATRYFWYVVARGTGGSSISSTFAFTTTAILAAPTLLSPANNSTAARKIPTLSWAASNGATSYDVYFGPTPSPVFYGSTTNTSITVGPLPAATRYYWYVIARAGTIVSPGTAVFSFITTSTASTGDIVWRNSQTGDVAGWLMNGLTLTQGAVIYSGLSSAWRIDGLGDLNGDGNVDVVFRNTQTGDVAAWLMNGLTLAQGAIVYSGLPAAWQIQAIGDLNGDGMADLVFRNVQTGDVAAWLMNGLTLAQGGIVYSGLSATWQIAKGADLNGDGKMDLVFRNTQTNDVAGWLMDGLSLAQAAIIYSNLPAEWQIAAAGDLDGDRKTDLVFRNAQTGDVAAWLMNGLVLRTGGVIYFGLPAAWQIKSTGDLNGDGKADLLFRNAQTGDVSGWLMNGLTPAQTAIIYSGLPSLWQEQGVGDLNGR